MAISNPDAPLLKLLHERELLLAQVNCSDDWSSDEVDSVCDLISELEEAAMRHRIVTPEGLAAYADLAREYTADNLNCGPEYHVIRVVMAFFDRVQDFAVQATA